MRLLSIVLLFLFGCSYGVARSLSPSSEPGTSPSPRNSNAPSPLAVAIGTVVDNDSDAGISGVSVAIAPGGSSTSTSPTHVATTDASGAFSFTAPPGTYMLIIGSNLPNDARSTYHGEILLAAGENAIAMGVPSQEPDVSLSVAQTGGSYRLEKLSSSQRSCLLGANAGRSALSLPQLVADQALLEIANALVSEEKAQGTEMPSPLFAGATGFEPSDFTGETTSRGFTTCDAWTGASYSYVAGEPPYPYAVLHTNVYYGAQWGASSPNGSFAAQLWGADPRPFALF